MTWLHSTQLDCFGLLCSGPVCCCLLSSAVVWLEERQVLRTSIVYDRTSVIFCSHIHIIYASPTPHKRVTRSWGSRLSCALLLWVSRPVTITLSHRMRCEALGSHVLFLSLRTVWQSWVVGRDDLRRRGDEGVSYFVVSTSSLVCVSVSFLSRLGSLVGDGCILCRFSSFQEARLRHEVRVCLSTHGHANSSSARWLAYFYLS
ncbi:hypothetical protein BD289DRAFT_9551 [Coniella lustricola]|uniref:Uncharacterized protein n=1 Tax=Coniella lustricola TaxID=2025994 RepID=A0A2T3A4J9_9PEZI|nr:hypothetical protein BD289DRAFT_9551 [Coniella lustricola]